jgi:hypothetical protein
MKIRKELAGTPVRIGTRTIVPVAKVDIRYATIGDERNGVALAWGRVVPHHLEVRDDEGSTRRIGIEGGSRTPFLGMTLGAGAIALVCSALMAFAGRSGKTPITTDRER